MESIISTHTKMGEMMRARRNVLASELLSSFNYSRPRRHRFKSPLTVWLQECKTLCTMHDAIDELLDECQGCGELLKNNIATVTKTLKDLTHHHQLNQDEYSQFCYTLQHHWIRNRVFTLKKVHIISGGDIV